MAFHQADQKLVWELRGLKILAEAWGADSIRVRTTMNAGFDEQAWALMEEPGITSGTITVEEDRAALQNGKLELEISKEGRIRFRNSETGETLIEETYPHFDYHYGEEFKSVGGDLYRIEALYKAWDGERLYGLGQHQHGLLDQKGCVINLCQKNTEVAIPFLVSSRKYGFLWNTPAVGRVELSRSHTRWVAEAANQQDTWVTTGGDYAEILDHYTQATGRSPLMPEWATGFWQCKLRYKSQDELLNVAREYKRRGLPINIIVVDFFHWPMMGEWKFDPEFWPDPAGMVRELDEMGIKLMVSVWPTINAACSNYEVMRDRGLIIRSERGLPAQQLFVDTHPDGPVYCTFYDATNPEARKFIWEKCRENYYGIGIKLFWLDNCEPDVVPKDFDQLRYDLGPGKAVSSIYPKLHAQGFYEGLRDAGETEIFTLIRSAWAGSQRYGTLVWSGDVPSTFEALQAQVRAGLNIGMSGIPWWITDIGGFWGGRTSSPSFRELIVRWFQFGVFCPVFRLHGWRDSTETMSGGDNEVWSFGEEAYQIIQQYMFLRERLRGYVWDQMTAAHETGSPVMRPLFYHFAHDPVCYEVEDQYLFGPDLLWRPCCTRGPVHGRCIYLTAAPGQMPGVESP